MTQRHEAAEAARRSVLHKRFAARWHRRCQTAAFWGWCDVVSERRRQRVVSKRLVAHFAMRRTAQVWCSWVRWCSERRRLRMISRRILSRTAARRTARMWQSWVDYCSDRRSQRSLVGRLLKRKANRTTSQYFDVWAMEFKKAAMGGQAAQDLQQTRDAFTRSFVARWKHTRLCRVWNTWVCTASNARRHRAIVGRLLARWKNKTAAAVMLSWQHFTTQRIDDRRAVGRVYRLISGQKYRSGWQTWCVFTVQQRKQEDHARRVEAVSQRAMRRWLSQRTTQCFNRWSEYVAVRHEQRMWMGRIVARLTNEHSLARFAHGPNMPQRSQIPSPKRDATTSYFSASW